MEVQTWPVDRISVRDRARQDLGDLASLKDSLTRLGQLQPIAARPDGTLVFGHRRLTAARELGWTEIAVRLYTAESAADILRAEQDENTCRLNLSPVEAARLAKKLREILMPEAERSHREGSSRGGRSEGFSKLGKPSVDTTRQAAKATGYSAETIRKVDEILAVAENPAEDPEVQQEAKTQTENLSKPGTKVDPAHKAVKQAQTRARRKRTHDHELVPGQVLQQPPPPPPVFPLERRLTDGINKGHGLKALAGEVQDRDDLDLTNDTISALQRRLRDEARERTNLARALGSVLSKRKASS